MTETKTLNLTPILLAWSGLFVLLAFIKDDWSLLWWAAMPWLVLIALSLVMTVSIGFFIWVKYMQGYPVTVDTPRKGKRIVRRGYPSRPVR